MDREMGWRDVLLTEGERKKKKKKEVLEMT